MRLILPLVLVCALALPALAGDCCGSCSCCDFPCATNCPIAKQANGCRSIGDEGDGISDALCKDLAAALEENLGKI